MDLAVKNVVEIVMASAMGLHGVPLLAVAICGSPWSVRGSPWSVRGSLWSVRGFPWNAVEIAVECRGGPWALPRCSAKKTNGVRPSSSLYHSEVQNDQRRRVKLEFQKICDETAPFRVAYELVPEKCVNVHLRAKKTVHVNVFTSKCIHMTA